MEAFQIDWSSLMMTWLYLRTPSETLSMRLIIMFWKQWSINSFVLQPPRQICNNLFRYEPIQSEGESSGVAWWFMIQKPTQWNDSSLITSAFLDFWSQNRLKSLEKKLRIPVFVLSRWNSLNSGESYKSDHNLVSDERRMDVMTKDDETDCWKDPFILSN